MSDNQKIICPDCQAEIEKPAEAEIGEILECRECGTEVELLSIAPLKYRELVEEK